MRHRGPRIVLAFGVLVGLASGLSLAEANPEQVGIATDVYYHAAEAFLAGEDFYAVRPPGLPGYGFLYPPLVVLAFVPHALTGSPAGAYALQTGLNLLATAALAAVLVRVTEAGHVELDRLDRGLLVCYALGSYGATSAFVMGQVNPQLALAVGAGAYLFERGREKRAGVAFGAAAVVKPFLAFVGVWFLRLRSTRAILAAIATGLGALLAGVVLGVEPTLAYLTEVIPREAATGSFAGGPDPASPYLTINRQLAALAPWLPPEVRTPVGALLLAPVALACARSVTTYRDRLVALGGALLATLALFPLEPFYLGLATVPIVPLAYLLEGTPRRLLLAGLLLLSAPVTMSAVEIWADALPRGLGGPLLDLATAAFRFALPPTYGVWLALAGLVLHQRL